MLLNKSLDWRESPRLPTKPEPTFSQPAGPRAHLATTGDIITAMPTHLADHALQCDVPYRRLGQSRRTASGTQL